MSDPFSRPKVRRVTVEIIDYDGNVAEFVYGADYADEPPDPSAGMEVVVGTKVDRQAESLDPYSAPRITSQLYGLELTVEHARSYSVRARPAPARAGDPEPPAELPAGQLAIEPADG